MKTLIKLFMAITILFILGMVVSGIMAGYEMLSVDSTWGELAIFCGISATAMVLIVLLMSAFKTLLED